MEVKPSDKEAVTTVVPTSAIAVGLKVKVLTTESKEAKLSAGEKEVVTV